MDASPLHGGGNTNNGPDDLAIIDGFPLQDNPFFLQRLRAALRPLRPDEVAFLQEVIDRPLPNLQPVSDAASNVVPFKPRIFKFQTNDSAYRSRPKPNLFKVISEICPRL